MLRFRSLGSGSSGNATLVEARSGATVTRLLVDCGLGIRQIDIRLGQAGLGAPQIDAIFITHEHSDHIGSALRLALRNRIPVWMSEGTYKAMGEPDFMGLLRIACDGQPMHVNDLHVMPFTVPHDAREPLQLRCSDGDRRLGVLTDLGHASSHVVAMLASCHALLLECNHDIDMLSSGPYPYFLKQRVGGLYGHLANCASAELAKALKHEGVKLVGAAHLSEQNNTPQLAQAALAQALDWEQAAIGVAYQAHGTQWLEV